MKYIIWWIDRRRYVVVIAGRHEADAERCFGSPDVIAACGDWTAPKLHCWMEKEAKNAVAYSTKGSKGRHPRYLNKSLQYHTLVYHSQAWLYYCTASGRPWLHQGDAEALAAAVDLWPVARMWITEVHSLPCHGVAAGLGVACLGVKVLPHFSLHCTYFSVVFIGRIKIYFQRGAKSYYSSALCTWLRRLNTGNKIGVIIYWPRRVLQHRCSTNKWLMSSSWPRW